MTDPFSPLTFNHGPALKNRITLAPLTNCQSHEDGRLSDDEFHWLTMRAKGGFGLTMTCASHVQAAGKGFPGQLGCWSDEHLPGLTRLATAIKAHNSVAVVQIHHAGMRSPAHLIGTQPMCPSDDEETKSRGISLAEIEKLREDFIAAAQRCEKAGFDGVEIHGAHGYILAQFLSPQYNKRTDQYGGSLANRARLIREIIDGVRARCRADFSVGLRLSAERFGVLLGDMVQLAQELMDEAKIDYLDVSLWDCFKEPEEAQFKGRPILSYFTALRRGSVRLGAAGKLYTAESVRAVLDAGCDFVTIGRAAVLHHDFPERVRADPNFHCIALPVTRAYLASQGLSPSMQRYMTNWKNFVADPLDEWQVKDQK